MKISACLIFITFLFSPVFAKDLPLDALINAGTVSHYQCIRQTYDEVALWLNMTDKGIPLNQSQAIANAKNAGLKVHIGFYPCRYLTPDQIFSEVIRSINQIPIERVFVQPIIQATSNCSWDRYSAQDNCLYIKSLFKMLNDRGLKTGVVSNKINWASIFGLDTSCPEVKDSLLAWIPSEYEQNKQPNLEHYTPFGGWAQPFCKFYMSKNICGRLYFLSYYPQ